VETREQFTRLREFGCDSIQGYYFAKPLPAEEIPGFSIPKEKL
jgi:EAL domain-containing protein (putative c-di-GMP-specific phosphodiesterase class I)